MTKRKPTIIKDNKRRGEWAESVFVMRAAENGLPVSKPFGESGSFDCVVGTPGKFAAVQVKCTMAEMQNGKGYVCSVKSNNKTYRAGAFDFLAAYVIPENCWYIVPAKLIRGLGSICLATTGSEGKYEEYREAWHLLRKATGCEEAASEPEETPMGPGVARVHAAMSFVRNYMEKNGRALR
jgi:PD-(D/E)XK endonuclease